ncbi:MAG: hypothetical protein ABI867_09290 [Kofleriaceae bacterium]
MLRIAVLILVAAGTAAAQPAPEPSGPHPRILLDESLRTAWKAAAKRSDSAVANAIIRCEATRSNAKEYQRDSYMGFDWGRSLNACLIAWVAKGDDADAQSAVIFINALLDDIEYIGDAKGGEKAVRRDTGYPIRSMPPYIALAYDWLHGHKVMTPALKQKIRERFEQWVGWYQKSGYHNRQAGTNYHAGYLVSASLVAVALGGEGGAFTTQLWNHVRDDIWGTDMAKQLAPRGLLDGGDFPEGWQYAPLTIAEYALAARVVGKYGVKIDNVDKWLTATFVRTMHARSGSLDTITPIGDSEDKVASIPINVMTLIGILVGPAPEIVQRQAAAEIARLGLRSKDYPFYEALAQARAVTPAAPVLEKWPTSYYAAGVSTFYARTSWAKDGVWMSTICTPVLEADHLAPIAGNLILTRGRDEVIVDPSPYGSLSSLTSNAPTVDSKQLPPKYRPSQAAWGETTHFVWAMQTATGVIATRCDYADQYKFQERPTDIAAAVRDFVLIPWGKTRADASVVVIDHAETGAADQKLYLRFRSPVMFGMNGEVANAKVGASTLSIVRVTPGVRSELRPEVRKAPVGACWEMDRGKCDMARMPVGEYRVEIPGPTMDVIHVVDAAASSDLKAEALPGGIAHLARGGRDAYVATKATSYSVKASDGAIHVILGDVMPPAATVTKVGDQCKVEVGPAPGVVGDPGPLVITLDASCKSTADVRVGPGSPDLAGSAAGTLINVGGVPQRKGQRRGCCAVGGSGSAGTLVLAVFVVGSLRRRRRATYGRHDASTSS